jgi:hypothetical protein
VQTQIDFREAAAKQFPAATSIVGNGAYAVRDKLTGALFLFEWPLEANCFWAEDTASRRKILITPETKQQARRTFDNSAIRSKAYR